MERFLVVCCVETKSRYFRVPNIMIISFHIYISPEDHDGQNSRNSQSQPELFLLNSWRVKFLLKIFRCVISAVQWLENSSGRCALDLLKCCIWKSKFCIYDFNFTEIHLRFLQKSVTRIIFSSDSLCSGRLPGHGTSPVAVFLDLLVLQQVMGHMAVRGSSEVLGRRDMSTASSAVRCIFYKPLKFSG